MDWRHPLCMADGQVVSFMAWAFLVFHTAAVIRLET
jgi:hypothetical protein